MGDDTALPELAAQIKARTAARDALARQLASLAEPVDDKALSLALEQRAADWRQKLRSGYPDEARYVVQHLIGPLTLWAGDKEDFDTAPGFDPDDQRGKEGLDVEDLGLKATASPEGC